ncbi:hypothetical protein HK102_005403, partial [Quaeritorhiza haematococci]
QHILIRELLDRGANPNAIQAVPYTPGVMGMLLERGADPNVNGWSTEILKFTTADLWILDTWILDHGWLPVPADRPYDPLSVFSRLVRKQRWAAATVLLDHFGQELETWGRVVFPTWYIMAMDSQFLKKLVTVFPVAVYFDEVIDWYSETNWTLDPSLLEILLEQQYFCDHRRIQ